MIALTCPWCQQPCQAEKTMAGAVLLCPKCGTEITVPRHSDPALGFFTAVALAGVIGFCAISLVTFCIYSIHSSGPAETVRANSLGMAAFAGCIGSFLCACISAAILLLIMVIRKLSS